MKVYKNAVELCADYDGTLYGLGRSLYKNVACGPWTRLVLNEDRTVYYENKAANDPDLLTNPDIIGIEIGSIVEGSDVEIGPEFLKFPFSKDDFWQTVENINNEADFYWKRDNTNDYLIKKGNKEYYFSDDEIKGLPKSLKNLFEKWNCEDSDLEEGESREIFKGVVLTRIDKSDFIY
jgi:hypothetical protein